MANSASNSTLSTVNASISMNPPAGVGAQTSLYAEMAISIIVPLLIFSLFVLIIWWGTKKAERKKRTIEMSYNLIALQLLAFLMLPVCKGSAICLLWSMLPVAMFALLIWFMYHRAKKEAEHKIRVIKGMKRGAVKLEKVEEKKADPKTKKGEGEVNHKYIEGIVRGVVEKKGGKKAGRKE